MRDAAQNAVANAMRKKGKKQQPLFKKRPKRPDEKKRLSKKRLRRIEESARRLKVR